MASVISPKFAEGFLRGLPEDKSCTQEKVSQAAFAIGKLLLFQFQIHVEPQPRGEDFLFCIREALLFQRVKIVYPRDSESILFCLHKNFLAVGTQFHSKLEPHRHHSIREIRILCSFGQSQTASILDGGIARY